MSWKAKVSSATCSTICITWPSVSTFHLANSVRASEEWGPEAEIGSAEVAAASARTHRTTCGRRGLVLKSTQIVFAIVASASSAGMDGGKYGFEAGRGVEGAHGVIADGVADLVPIFQWQL